jgi:multidrug efflux pump subunit AcrA (membrane-fusion protein)
MMKPVLFTTLVLASLGAAACSSEHAERPATATPVSVTSTTAVEMELAQPFEAGGVVKARRVATVVSRIMGEVKAVHVKPGDHVRAGQVLVSLDARELSAHRNQATAAGAATQQSASLADADRQAAEAGLALARVTYQRISDLRAKNSATQHELDEATAALKGAEARLKVSEARAAEAKAAIASAGAAADAASVMASYASLVAPFDGVVTEKMVEPGNMAGPGQPAVTVEDTRSFQLEVRLDESRAAAARVGDTVPLRLDLAAGVVPVIGTVAEVARLLTPGSHDFVVKIDVPQGQDLRSGMFGRAIFRGDSHRGVGVPASSITRRGQLAYVFVVDADGRARLRLVNASDAAGDVSEIRSGVIAGEQVVNTPPATLVDGNPVTVAGTSGGRR